MLPDCVRRFVQPLGCALRAAAALSVRLALFAGAAATPAYAQTAPTNDDCQACHAEPTMTRANGSPVVVEPQAFTDSAHGFFSCVDCHADLATVTEFPHAEDLAPVDCAVCHDAPELLSMSVHARAAPGAAGGPLQCADCHGPPHRIRPSRETDSRTHRENVVPTCAACHTTIAPPGTRAGPAVAALFADSIHGQRLQQGNADAPTCSSCHRSHDILTKTEPASPVHRLNVAETCGSCHMQPAQEFRDGIHGARLGEGHPDAPTCTSCHTAHGIRATDSDEWQISAVEQCGTCHREALTTYRDTFHGQVTALGFTPVAKCVDCHRPHRVVALTDPDSPVRGANLIATCQKCHPAANANFVKYQPHASKDDPERLPALYYAARFMNVLLIGTFSFFGLHSVLWFVRERTGTDARPYEDQGPDADADRDEGAGNG